MGATQPIESWQFFLEAREVLGIPAMQRIFGNVSTTSIGRWSRNPSCSADSQPGPLLHFAELLRLLVQQGRADLAEAGLRLLAEPCGAHVSFAEAKQSAETPEAPSAAANLVEAVAELQRAVRSGTDPKVVDALTDVLVARAKELAQSVRTPHGRVARWSRGDAAAQKSAPSAGSSIMSFIMRRKG